MTGFTDRVSRGVLNHVTGKTAMFTLPTAYLALFTGVGLDDGTGFTEVSAAGYARVATAAADWNTAGGSAPSTITNAAAINFPLPGAAWTAVIAFGIYDASTSGNLLVWDYLGNFDWLPATVSLASPGVLTVPAHGFTAGDLVIWTNEYGGASPTFSQSNFTGPLTVTSPAANTFTAVNAGTAVNTSSVGNGMVRKLASQTLASGVPVAFPVGSLTIASG
jgi:hypothetical protein